MRYISKITQGMNEIALTGKMGGISGVDINQYSKAFYSH